MVSIKKSFVSYMSFYYYYLFNNYIKNKQEYLNIKQVTSSITINNNNINNVKKSFRVNQLTLKFIINF